jgi:hypothetical protein
MAVVVPPPFPAPDLAILCTEISKEINTEFAGWLLTYTVSTMGYTGKSTATPVSPGEFTALNDSSTVLAAGAGTDPAGFSANVQGVLTSLGWNLVASKLPILLNAVETALVAAWETWLASPISGDAAAGPAAAATGTGAGLSTGGLIQ